MGEAEGAVLTLPVGMGEELVATNDALIPTPGAAPPEKRGRGRPKGSRNKVSREAQDFCRRLTKNPEYRKKLREDFIRRKKSIPPQLEQMIWAYAHGKPVDQVNINTDTQQAPTAFVLVLNGQILVPARGEDTDQIIDGHSDGGK
jgi:hypothetical protein